MLLNRQQIAAMIPHGESMCLLDGVVAANANSITCVATHPLAASNPLLESVLGSWILIEYGAQAAAVHKGMQAGSAQASAGSPEARATGSRTGAYIAQVKDVRIGQPAVSAGELSIHAECLVSDAAAAAYQIDIRCGDSNLLSGRITLALG